MEKKEIATRQGYGIGLAKLGEINKDVVALDADLSCSTKSADFAKKFPDRFFNVGISEQDMIGTAAGLATCGKIAFASTFAVFATGRAYDQIRNSVAYSKTNVKVVGTHAGMLTGEDGASHQSLEDIALMRAMPNMMVVSPCDGIEAEKATIALAKHNGPAYLRLGRGKVPQIFDDSYEFELGKGIVLREGKDVSIIATGALVHEAIKAAEELSKEKIDVRVINIHTIKPLDEAIVLKAAEETGAIVTAEDHSIIGGLGGAVAELTAEKLPTPVLRVGVKDVFGESGKPKELYKKYGLDSDAIVKKVKEVIGLKTRLEE